MPVILPPKVELVLPVSNVHFDLTSILTTLAQNAVIMETRGLTRCLLSESTTNKGEKQMVLNTEGINMHEMFNHGDVRAVGGHRMHKYLVSVTIPMQVSVLVLKMYQYQCRCSLSVPLLEYCS